VIEAETLAEARRAFEIRSEIDLHVGGAGELGVRHAGKIVFPEIGDGRNFAISRMKVAWYRRLVGFMLDYGG
jgi:hypothetical protein